MVYNSFFEQNILKEIAICMQYNKSNFENINNIYIRNLLQKYIDVLDIYIKLKKKYNKNILIKIKKLLFFFEFNVCITLDGAKGEEGFTDSKNSFSDYNYFLIIEYQYIYKLYLQSKEFFSNLKKNEQVEMFYTNKLQIIYINYIEEFNSKNEDQLITYYNFLIGLDSFYLYNLQKLNIHNLLDNFYNIFLKKYIFNYPTAYLYLGQHVLNNNIQTCLCNNEKFKSSYTCPGSLNKNNKSHIKKYRFFFPKIK